jgi:hypothetical protein
VRYEVKGLKALNSGDTLTFTYDGGPDVTVTAVPDPPPEPETTFLLVEVDKAIIAMRRLAENAESVGIRSVTVHNDEYPHGCCCQHCPHNGNCRD